jgi:hypothetical protein
MQTLRLEDRSGAYLAGFTHIALGGLYIVVVARLLLGDASLTGMIAVGAGPGAKPTTTFATRSVPTGSRRGHGPADQRRPTEV